MSSLYVNRHLSDMVLYVWIINFVLCLYRSEEHTSELQSRRDLVCRLLLEKKMNTSYSVEQCMSCPFMRPPSSFDDPLTGLGIRRSLFSKSAEVIERSVCPALKQRSERWAT